MAVLAVLSIDIVISQFPRGLIVLACLVLAFAAAWYGLTRTGGARLLGSGIAILAVALTVVVLIADGDHLAQALVIVVGLGLMLLATRSAFKINVPLHRAPDPHHPVLFYNPKSGGGKAEKFHLAEEARARGIEPIELKLGTDLEQLVRGAVADGADALAMAGGDGSQAVVAMVAAEQDLPYACIPAGTRNHFALDLGVDRDDVIGALGAFVGGRERRVDLAEINGRVFVNNVSIGLYAEAVQREGYREAKLRTILDTLPEVLGPEGKGLDLRWTGPGGMSIPPERRSSSPTIATASGARSARAPGRGSTTSCWASPLLPRRLQAGASSSGLGESGLHLPSRLTQTARSPRESTARPSLWTRHCASGSCRRRWGCGSPPHIPGPLRPRRCPRAPGRPFSRWCGSLYGGRRDAREHRPDERVAQ